MTSIHERACFGVYAHGELAADADRIAAAIGSGLDELLAPGGGVTLLLTGATGFVGMELLARLVSAPAGAAPPVVALIRADDDAHATQRLHADAACRCSARSRRTRAGSRRSRATSNGPASGSTRRSPPRSPRSSTARRRCPSTLALDRSRAINVEGTRRVLAFARALPAAAAPDVRLDGLRGGRRTAACSARTTTTSASASATPTSSRSSRPSGSCGRPARPGCRCTIVRPSIVVGDRHSGWTASFNVLYWPLRALAQGGYPILPARRGAPVDVVSVDYVADAICALHRHAAAEGPTFHLTASEHASSIGELLDLAVARFACRRPPLVAPTLYRRALHPLRPAGARAAAGASSARRVVPAVLRDGRPLRRRAHPSGARRGDRARAAAHALRPPHRPRAPRALGRSTDRQGRCAGCASTAAQRCRVAGWGRPGGPAE